MAEFALETERLILRDWRDADLEPFHAICSDPKVMATLGPVMSRDEVAALIARLQTLQANLGHCFWAMERKGDGALIGWCGLIRGAEGTPVAGKVEAGWRMTPAAWGKGYVTEAAIACLDWAFENLNDGAVWAITSAGNRASRAVMERLGMEYRPEWDFEHPKVATDSPLLHHVTYCIERAAWTRKGDAA
jgi:RimJ/RimL family protein N-acetyltransferase